MKSWPWLLGPLALLGLPLLAVQEHGRHGDQGDRAIDYVNDKLSPSPPGSPPPVIGKQCAALSGVDAERGAPFLVALEGGRAWLGCNEWDAAAGDRIVVRELDPDGRPARTLVVNATAAEIVRPTGVLDATGRLWVFWTQLVDGLAQLMASHLERVEGGEERFTPPQQLTSGATPNENVEAALHSDRQLWLTWESFVPPDAGASAGRGSIDVVLAPLTEKEGAATLGERVRIGDGPGSDLDPAIASQGDRLFVVWSAYAGRDYEVKLRGFAPARKELDPIVEISADALSDDIHPAIAASASELWIAWDRLEDSTRGSSLPMDQRDSTHAEEHTVFVMTARIRGGQIELPKSRRNWPDGAVAGAPYFSWMGGVPRITLAGDGKPWIAYRYLLQASLQQKRYGDPVIVHAFTDHGWSAATELENSLGFAEEPALARAGEGVYVAAQSDRRLKTASLWNGAQAPAPLRAALAERRVECATWIGPTGIAIGKIAAPPDAANNAAVEFVPRPDRRAGAHFHPAGEALVDPFISGEKHYEVKRGEQTWTVYWGDLHRHSSISRCSRGLEPTPVQRYEFGRDVHLYDFMAMTDHAGQIDPFSWWQLDKMCWLYRDPIFCPIAGFECSTRHNGHQNVILDGRLTPLVALVGHDDDALPFLYDHLPVDHAVSIPHATADTGKRTRFDECDPRFVKLVEVYQALRGSYEFEGCYRQAMRSGEFGSFVQDGLMQGWKFGIIASTDHGNGASYACALASSLDPKAIFEALHRRRTYGATTKGILVDFRIDDALMGEDVVCSAPPRVHVKVHAAHELAEVVVFRNGRLWRALGRPPRAADAEVEATLDLDVPFGTTAPRADWTIALTIAGADWRSWPGRGPVTLSGDKQRACWRVEGEKAIFLWPKTYIGAQPNDLRLCVRAKRNAKVTFESRGEPREIAFDRLIARPISGRFGDDTWRLTPLENYDVDVNPERGLGVKEVEQEWADEQLAEGDAWYYARVIQTDGELAWSSPIFVERK